MGYKLVDCRCQNCGVVQEYLAHHSEEVPYICNSCGMRTLFVIPSAPAIRTSDSASFLDGHKRKHMQDLKEAARLEVAAANAEGEEKAAIKKEIYRLTKL